MNKTKILAICGSLRARSSNLSLLQATESLTSELFEFTYFEGLGELPHFNPDLDLDDVPDSVAQLRTSIRDADGIVICTPEYVHGLPGSVKNAIDWTVSSGEWMEKPVLILNASLMSHFAHDSLIEILTTVMAKVLPRRVGLPGNSMDVSAMVESEEIRSKILTAAEDLQRLIAEQ
jgi:chromate reductase